MRAPIARHTNPLPLTVAGTWTGRLRALLTFTLLIVLTLLLTTARAAAVDSVADRAALVDLYQTMGGAQWTTQTNWLSTNVSMCAWNGVACQAECRTSNATGIVCRVTELNLGANGLRGAIAPAVQQLTSLTKLVLAGNALGGTIPNFTTLVQLQRLWLYSNQLTGGIPNFATLTQLQDLRLYSNQLTGSVPNFTTLTQLQRLVLDSNQLTGGIPNFTTLPQLQQLWLNSNRLTGSIPLFFRLAQLQILRLSNNLLSGDMPNFKDNTALMQLDLSTNLLSGALPSLVTLAQLQQLRIARNQFSGQLPTSWRTLRALTFVDVAENSLSDEIRLFQPHSLPPLSARFVNLSFNSFGGVFSELPPPETLNLTAIDIRNNSLLCPYPLFPRTIRVLSFNCKNAWVRLGTYAGIAAGTFAVAIVMYRYLAVKRLVSEPTLRAVLFAASWFVSVGGVLSDAYSYSIMVSYLQQKSFNCDSLNELRVFNPLLSVGDLPLPLQAVADTFSFANWIDPQVWMDAFSNGLELVTVYTNKFVLECTRARECAYDAVQKRCYEAHPDLATSGGGAHQAFLYAVIAFIVIRAAYELFCLLVIVVSCARNALVLSCRVWIKSSAFVPLLLVRASTRASLLTDVVLADAPPSEYIWELMTKGVFVMGVKLFAQLYYLLRVAQTGLAWSNWLSLALGIVTVPRLVAQAAWSWHKLRQMELEEHYSVRAASGSAFDLNDMSGGSVNNPTTNADAVDIKQPDVQHIGMSMLDGQGVTSSNFTNDDSSAAI